MVSPYGSVTHWTADGYDGGVDDVEPVLSFEEWCDAVNNGPPGTPDDVSITWDGRALDTKEKWLAFLAEIEAEDTAGITFEELERRRGDHWHRVDRDWDPVSDRRA